MRPSPYSLQTSNRAPPMLCGKVTRGCCMYKVEVTNKEACVLCREKVPSCEGTYKLRALHMLMQGGDQDAFVWMAQMNNATRLI